MSPTDWSAGTTCTVAVGSGICPSSYSADANHIGMNATVPRLDAGGRLTFIVKLPVVALQQTIGAQQPGLSVTAGDGAVDTNPETNSARTSIVIRPPLVGYSIDASGASGAISAPGGVTETNQEVIHNDGDPNGLSMSLQLVDGQGTGSADPTDSYLSGMNITSVACSATTGGASCADAVAVTTGHPTTPPPPSILTGPGVAASVGVLHMPTGSSATFTVTVQVGLSLCTTGPSAADRTLALTASVDALSAPDGIDFPEDIAGATTADNQADIDATVGADVCASGDLTVQAVTQPLSQQNLGLNALTPFSYGVTYTSSASSLSAALGATIHFSAWSSSFDTPTCVAIGDAVCPTSFSPGSSEDIDGIVPRLGPGGSLQVNLHRGVGARRPDAVSTSGQTGHRHHRPADGVVHRHLLRPDRRSVPAQQLELRKYPGQHRSALQFHL